MMMVRVNQNSMRACNEVKPHSDTLALVIKAQGGTANDYDSTAQMNDNLYENLELQKILLTRRIIKDKSYFSHTSLQNRLEVATGRASVYVMNFAKLTPLQRTKLWHWRLAHCGPDALRFLDNLDEKGVPAVHGMGVLDHKFHQDCTVCDKAKFRVKQIKRIPSTIKRLMAPFHTVYVDGFGGQTSMGTTSHGGTFDNFGVKSVGGAVGGYVFCCVSTDAVIPYLYTRKSQFPMILKQFLIGVMAMHWRVHVIRATDAEIVDNGEVEVICADFEVRMEPTSVGTPGELGRGETNVGNIVRRARAMMIGAGHLPPSLWGAAIMYSGVVQFVLPTSANNGLSPYELSKGRPPHLRQLMIGVFGCPAEARTVPTGAKYKTKMSARTDTFYFVGTEYPAVLLYHPSKNKIFRISSRKVRLHEGAYVTSEPLNLMQLKERIVFDQNESEEDKEQTLEVIKTVPTVTSLRIHGDKLSDQGKSLSEIVEPHVEVNEEIENLANRKFTDAVAAQILQSLQEPSLLAKIVTLVRSRTNQVQVNTTPALPNDVDVAVGGDDSADNRKTVQQLDINNSPENNERYSLRDRSKTKGQTQGSDTIVDTKSVEERRVTTLDTKKTDSEIDMSIELHRRLRIPLNRAPAGTRVKIKTTRFDGEVPGSFSRGKPEYTFGSIRGSSTGGKRKVLWDGDSKQELSHWTHLDYAAIEHDPGYKNVIPTLLMNLRKAIAEPTKRFGYYLAMGVAVGLPEYAEPYRTLHNIEVAATQWVLQVKTKKQLPPEWPRSFLECLLKPDWREWLAAVLKEHKSWVDQDVAEDHPRRDRKFGEALIRIGELYSIKRCGMKKFRPYMLGNLLTPERDFFDTFSSTVTADSIKVFFSMATELGKLVFGGDVKCAYLTGTQQTTIWSHKPSYWDFINMTIEELMEVRKLVVDAHSKGGKSAVRRMSKNMISNDRILLIKRPVYGIPDAGAEFQQTLIHNMVHKLKFKRSVIDGCVYYKTNGVLETTVGPFKSGLTKHVHQGTVDGLPQDRKRSVWVTEYIVILSWTDDMPYFGTSQMVEWYEREVKPVMPIELSGECKDFVSIEIKQNLKEGTTELLHQKYCLAMGEKFKEHLKSRSCKIPIKPEVATSLLAIVPTDKEHEDVESFPYRELIGTMAFPVQHTKLECKFAISVLSRFLANWTAEVIEAALDLLAYMVFTADIGIIYSRGLDSFGGNVPYAFTDSGFSAPRSQGCSVTKMNGALISCSSKRHSTVDTSTTAAELTEAFLGSNIVVGMRNLLIELGFQIKWPTIMFQDNFPCLQLVTGSRNLQSTTRTLDIRVWKLKERVDMQEIEMIYCPTHDMQADLGTKGLPTRTFRFLRDCINGYALVLLSMPDRAMPVGCISSQQLEEMLVELEDGDCKRNAKAKEGKAKAKENLQKGKHLRFKL